MNGVINIITRRASDTQGLLVDAAAGDRKATASLRYGGTIGRDVAHRIYAKAFRDGQSRTIDGDKAHDSWSRPEVGFRVDWTPSATDALTLQGDAYNGTENQLGAPDEKIRGRNIVTRWNRDMGSAGALQVQAYYDRTERITEDGGGSFGLDTYDLDLQHSISLGQAHDVVWGGGARVSHYVINGTAGLRFAPPRRTLFLGNAFIQDKIALTGELALVVGLKAEDDPYVGWSLLPNARLSWSPDNRVLLWGAASRAIRSPTPFDEDVVEAIGPTVFLTGNDAFRTEKLTAFELGLRAQPSDSFSFSISSFYNLYDDLRSIEINPAGFPPLRWGNALKGQSYGAEAWAISSSRPSGA